MVKQVSISINFRISKSLWFLSHKGFFLSKVFLMIFFQISFINVVLGQFENISNNKVLKNNISPLYINASFNCEYPQQDKNLDSLLNTIYKGNYTFESAYNKDGKLLFISDARHIYNSHFKMMKGGKNAVLIRRNKVYIGVNSKSHIIVPQPGLENMYNIFYLNYHEYDPQPYDKAKMSFNRVQINMNGDGGLGSVVKKIQI
jgi:hypothetical protein